MESQVLGALREAFSIRSPHRAAANELLTAFQHSPAAWEVSCSLLQQNGMAIEVCLFAAQTLRQKVRQQLGTLDTADIAVLHQRLLLCIMSACEGPTQTLTQLCVAMASLIIQRELYRSGAEALQLLGASLPTRAMLKLLEVLPDEAANELYLKMSSTDRRLLEAKYRVREWSPDVLTWIWERLQGAVQSPRDAHWPLVPLAECFGAWVRLGGLHGLTEDHQGAAHLIHFIFDSLQRGFEELGRACWNVAEAIAEHGPDSLQPLLLSLADIFPDLATQALQSSQVDKAERLCSVFATLCTCNMQLWTSSTAKGEQMRQGLARLATSHSPGILTATFQPATATALEAWGLIADHMADTGSATTGCSDLRRIDKAAEQQFFASFVTELLPILSGDDAPGSQLLHLDDTMPAYFAQDALKETCRVLGHQAYVAAVMASVLPGSGIPAAEAAVFALSLAEEHLAAGLLQDASTSGAACSDSILKLLTHSASLAASAADSSLPTLTLVLLGSLAAALMRRCSQPDSQTKPQNFTDFAFGLAGRALGDPKTAVSAAVLARRVCEAACLHGLPVPDTVREGILQLLDGGLSLQVEGDLVLAVEHCLQSLPQQSPQLCQEVVVRLLRQLPAALERTLSVAPSSRTGPRQLVHQTIEGTLPPINRLLILLQAEPRGPFSAELAAPEQPDFPSCDMRGAAVASFLQLWQLLGGCLAIPEAGELRSLISKCCTLALQASPAAELPMAAAIARAAASCFQLPEGHTLASPLAAAITAASGASESDMHASASAWVAIDSALLSVADSPQMQLSAAPRKGDNAPEWAEAVMVLTSATARHCSSHRGNGAKLLLERGLAAAVGCISCHHKERASGALTCLASLIDQARADRKAGDGFLALAIFAMGPDIMRGLLLALLGPSPLARVHKVSCIMGHMAALPCQQSTVEVAMLWLQCALQSLPPGILKEGESDGLLRALGRHMSAGVQEALEGSVSSYTKATSGSLLKKALRRFAEEKQTLGM